VEDLLQVSGIGDKKFARMRPFVMVGSGGKGSHK
jgi:DNA uptake protein ComE-like DNA-binding protein